MQIMKARASSSQKYKSYAGFSAVKVGNILRGHSKYVVYIKKSNHVIRPSIYLVKSLKSS